MFKLENDAQRQRTIERIEEVAARIEKMRATHGPAEPVNNFETLWSII